MEGHMPKTIITTDSVAVPTNPFSLATRANGIVFISGQVGKNQSGKIVDGFSRQVTQAMENVKSIVQAAGCTMEDIVKVTIYVTDINRMGELNEIYTSYFTGDLPARATVEVRGLGLNAEVEIDAIAICT